MGKNNRKPVTGSIYFDYKDVKTLQRYVNQFGQIEVRKRTGLTEMQQRRLAKAIKRARHIALLPFVAHNQSVIVRQKEFQMTSDICKTKKEIANEIFSALNPHFSALLGATSGAAVQTAGATVGKNLAEACQTWFAKDDASQLMGILLTAQVTGAISQAELDSFMDAIASAQ